MNKKQQIDSLTPYTSTFPCKKAGNHVSEAKRKVGRIVVRVVLTILALGGMAIGTLKTGTPKVAKAASPLEYTVDPTNAAGGVYARYGPHIDDTNRVNGYGVYPNEVVELLCGVTDGDSVGQYSNTTWHFVTDLSNAGEGDFWVSDHYLDTPNGAGQLTPGESLCPNENPNPFATPDPVQPPATPNQVGNCYGNFPGSLLGSSQLDPTQGEWNNNNSQILVCVHATLSTPDTLNHRQYISTVEADIPYVDPPGCDIAHLVEVWGDGFYQTTNCTSPTVWNINKWLASGTYVCAAISSAYDTGGYLNAAEADAAVQSGQAQLGSADPARTITCIAINA